MICAVYSLKGRIGECRSLFGTGEVIEITVTPVTEGTLLIGDKSAVLDNGTCRINVKNLHPGVYTPLLTSAGHTFTLEPLIAERGSVRAAPTPDSTYRAALVRLEAVEEKIKNLEERINELTVMVKGNGLFG